MKICVFSDSHCNFLPIQRAIIENRPDLIIHLGDGKGDVNKIRSQFPNIPLRAVWGNCDLNAGLPDKEIFDCCGARIFMTHGHLYGVKSGLSSLLDAGYSAGANLVLYGHTHVAHYESISGMQVLNPGSCMDESSARFAVVVITDGAIECRLV